MHHSDYVCMRLVSMCMIRRAKHKVMWLADRFVELQHTLHDHAEDYERLASTQAVSQSGSANSRNESAATSHVDEMDPLHMLQEQLHQQVRQSFITRRIIVAYGPGRALFVHVHLSSLLLSLVRTRSKLSKMQSLSSCRQQWLQYCVSLRVPFAPRKAFVQILLPPEFRSAKTEGKCHEAPPWC